VCLHAEAMLWLRQQVTDFSQPRARFSSRSVVWDLRWAKWYWGMFPPGLGFPRSPFCCTLNSHRRFLSGAGRCNSDWRTKWPQSRPIVRVHSGFLSAGIPMLQRTLSIPSSFSFEFWLHIILSLYVLILSPKHWPPFKFYSFCRDGPRHSLSG
jgi:hypothetical protein